MLLFISCTEKSDATASSSSLIASWPLSVFGFGGYARNKLNVVRVKSAAKGAAVGPDASTRLGSARHSAV